MVVEVVVEPSPASGASCRGLSNTIDTIFAVSKRMYAVYHTHRNSLRYSAQCVRSRKDEAEVLRESGRRGSPTRPPSSKCSVHERRCAAVTWSVCIDANLKGAA